MTHFARGNVLRGDEPLRLFMFLHGVAVLGKLIILAREMGLSNFSKSYFKMLLRDAL